MPKRHTFGKELREKCSFTMELIHKAVSSSLGPSGKLSLLDIPHRTGLITKDGVTIAKNCRPLEDEVCDKLAEQILDIAVKTNSQSGDGTTTSIVLANALFQYAKKELEQNANPVVIKDQIEEELPKIIAQLDEMAEQIDTFDKVTEIATISANNDPVIGKIISQAIEKVGEDGFVTLTEGDSEEATLKITEGYQTDKGCATERYLKNKGEIEFHEPYILIFDGKIEDPHTLNDLYLEIAPKPFIVVAELSEPASKFLMGNVVEGNMEGMHILPPGYKASRSQYLEDLAAITGATLYNQFTLKEGETDARKLTKFDLGRAKKVVVNKYNADFVGMVGDKEDVKEQKLGVLARIEELKSQMESTKSQFEQDRIRHRIGKLTGGVAVIGVGGVTENETLERKDRFEDALNAARSALQEGIIPGGGYALFKIAQGMRPKNSGQKILKRALEAPLRTILRNTGIESDNILEELKDKKNLRKNLGYNAKTHEFQDLKESGVIDPVKSTKSGLRNAVSIVDLLINLDFMSVNVLDKDNVRDMMKVMKNLQQD